MKPSIFAEFVAAGYSPIPRYEIEGKHVWPKRWSDFCDRQATDAERAKWGPPDGVALCCGYGNLLAVDVDTDDLQVKKAVVDALPHCHIARYGSKGYALLVRYQGERIPSIYPADENCKQPLVEFKGYGANITVPPSRHAKTRSPYSWLDVEAGEIIEAVPPLDKLPIVTPADIKRVQEALAPYALAPRKRESLSSGSSSAEVKPGRHAAYFKAGYDAETKALAALSEGRPTALFRAVCSLGWGVHHSVIGKAEFAAGLHGRLQKQWAARSGGRQGDRGDDQQRPRALIERPVAGAEGHAAARGAVHGRVGERTYSRRTPIATILARSRLKIPARPMRRKSPTSRSRLIASTSTTYLGRRKARTRSRCATNGTCGWRFNLWACPLATTSSTTRRRLAGCRTTALGWTTQPSMPRGHVSGGSAA